MTDTTFVSKVTAIATGWMQDLNNFYYRLTGQPTKGTPVGADLLVIGDSTSGGSVKTLSFTNLVTYLSGLCSAGWNAFTATSATTATVANRVDSGIATVASATTPDIFGAASNTINYTGTATATGFVAAAKAGMQRTLICNGAAAFTAGVNLLIEGINSGNTITLGANAIVNVVALTTTQFKMTYSLTGSFTITGTGFTVNPTGTASYSVNNGVIILTVPSLFGTSNATTFILTGLPAAITPIGLYYTSIAQGLDASASVQIVPALNGNSIILYKNAPVGTWTASGGKQLYLSSFIYPAN